MKQENKKWIVIGIIVLLVLLPQLMKKEDSLCSNPLRCSDNGKHIQICINGKWGDYYDCPAGMLCSKEDTTYTCVPSDEAPEPRKRDTSWLWIFIGGLAIVILLKYNQQISK